MLARLHKRAGKDAIMVAHGAKASGQLCLSSEQPKSGFSVISFPEILDAFRFVLKERSFIFGAYRFDRLTGYPMGRSFSEPATLVDLQESIYRLYTRTEISMGVGWYVPRSTIAPTIAGLEHVDDSLVDS